MKTQVISTSVESVEYDFDIEDLMITYKNGSSYLYADVSEAVFDDLLDAESIGRFVNSQIKPNYLCSKV